MKRSTSLFVICLVIGITAFGQKDQYLEELGIYSNGHSSKSDVATVDQLNETIKDTLYSNAKKAANYSRINFNLAKKIEYGKGQVDALLNLSIAMLYSNEMDSALIFTNMALGIAERLNDENLKIKAHELLGGVYSYTGDYDKSAEEYFKTIKLAEKLDEKLTITGYVNLGHVFKMIGNKEKSREYCKKGYTLGKKYQDTAVMITALNILGLLDKNEGNEESALKYYEEGLGYARKTKNLERQSQILYNMANVYFRQKKYDAGFVLYDESIEISKVNGSYAMIAIGFHGGALTFLEIGKLTESTKYADSALHYALLSKNYDAIMESYEIQSKIAKTKGLFKKGLTYMELAYIYKDSMNLTELNSAALNAEDSFEKEKTHIADSLDKIQTELEAKHNQKINDEKVKNREVLLWISGIILIIVTIGIYFLYKKNKLIKSQNAIVNKQKSEIQIQHQEITDSINYAKRIQEAIISKENEWNAISEDHFILFKPKDVVSGDFYWAYHDSLNNRSIWAVADCTGHGVPGAFMSMLGIGLLNEIIIDNKVSDPAEILNHLRSKIIAALDQNEVDKSKDGMDISLCVLDKKTNILTYAGANNPLWIIRKETLKNAEIIKNSINIGDGSPMLHEVAPDKMPIGNFFAVPPPFSNKKIEVLNGDLFLLITDGFADQFGGELGKKYKYKPLKELLIRLQSSPITSQSTALEKEFNHWRGNEEQIDDVCIVGVKITI